MTTLISMLDPGHYTLLILCFVLMLALWAVYRQQTTKEQEASNKSTSESSTPSDDESYDELVEHASDIIFRLRSNGDILSINNAGAKLLGYPKEELIGKNISKFMEEVQSDSMIIDSSKEYSHRDLILLDSNKQRVYLEMSLRRSRAQGKTLFQEVIARNVTERRWLEAQLRQNERLHAMGLLAGGIAHDFNNYLTVILNYVDLVLETKPSDEVVHMLEQIRKAGMGATEVSRSMLEFSRKHSKQENIVSLNKVIKQSERMLQTALGKKADVKLQMASGLRAIKGDVGSIEHVLLNLIIQARNNIVDQGKVIIRSLPGEDNRHVLLEVKDSGKALTPEQLSKLFQPFFTTEMEDASTRLGLASVQRIITKLGGTIEATSNEGQGTTFLIRWPTA
ncbi:MAG TPA: ATP-binding protein [Gemmatales bacterium]|nr:ATP-binding protein [Gemmatales bacterium]